MKKSLKLALIMRLSSILLFCCCSMACYGETPLRTLEGKTIHLSDYRGQWVVINYWADWCDTCRKEIPALNAFYKAHQGRGAILLGVNYDQLSAVDLKKVLQTLPIHYPLLLTDPSSQLGIGPIEFLPVTYLISPEGKIQPPLLGEQTQKSLEVATGLQSR